jgi:hypothetical protein
MTEIPRIPEVLPNEVLRLLGSLPICAPPSEHLPAIRAAVQEAAADLPEGKKGVLRIRYELDQYEKKNEVGIVLVHKFNKHARIEGFAGYDWGERRGAKVTAELVFEWEP